MGYQRNQNPKREFHSVAQAGLELDLKFSLSSSWNYKLTLYCPSVSVRKCRETKNQPICTRPL